MDVLGNRIILDNLDKLEVTIRDGVQQVMEDAATVGLQVLEDRAAVRTGFMKSRGYVEVTPGQIVLGDDADYSVFVELGTYKMDAQPFIVPGAVAAGDYLMKHLGGIL